MSLMRLPGYDTGSALLNLNPLNQAIQFGAQQQQRGFENERALTKEKMAQEQFDLAKQDRMIKQAGNLALAVINDPDPARGQANFQKFLSMVPGAAEDLAKNGIDPKDHMTAARAIAAKAGVLPDPLDQRIKTAQASTAEGGLAMQPLQRESMQLDIQTKRKALEEPKSDTVTLGEGQTLAQRVRKPDGTIEVTPIIQGSPKAPPEHISKTANFAGRMIEAERHVRRMTEGTDPISGQASPKFGATNVTTGIVNMAPDGIANLVRSPEHQQYRQAAKQWIRAFLRKESGAAIGQDEFAQDFQTYFPQPGDKPEVVAQKRAARAAAMNGFALEAGDYFTKQRPDLVQHLKLYSGTSPDSTIRGPVTIRSDDDYNRLPSGARFIGPDGNERIKP